MPLRPALEYAITQVLLIITFMQDFDVAYSNKDLPLIGNAHCKNIRLALLS